MKTNGPLDPESDPHYTDLDHAQAGKQDQERFHSGHVNAEHFRASEPPELTCRFKTLPKLLHTYAPDRGAPLGLVAVEPSALAERILHFRKIRSQYFDPAGHLRRKNPAFLTTLFLFPPQGAFFAALEDKGVLPEPHILRAMNAGIRRWKERTNFEIFGLVLNLNQGCPHGHPLAVTVSGEGRLLRPPDFKPNGPNQPPNLGPSHLGVWRRKFFGIEVPKSDIKALLDDWGAREKRADNKILDADVADAIDNEFLVLLREHPDWKPLWEQCLEDYAKRVRESAQYQFRAALDIALRYGLPFLTRVHAGLCAARSGNRASVDPDVANALTHENKTWTITPSMKSDVLFLRQHCREKATQSLLDDMLKTNGRQFDPVAILQEVTSIAQADRRTEALNRAKFIIPHEGKLILRPHVQDDLKKFSPGDLEEIQRYLELISALVSEPEPPDIDKGLKME